MAGTAGSGIPEHRLPFLTYALLNGKPNCTSFFQLKQILSYGFSNPFIRAYSCLVLNP